MKKVIGIIFLLIVFGLVAFFQKDITDYIVNSFIYNRRITIQDKNEYALDKNYKFVQKTNNFYPKNRNDLLNVFYTMLDNGWEEFQFFCDSSYTSCLSDVEGLTDKNSEISHINNLVHPFNSYNKIIINYNNLGEIKVYITKLYSPDEMSEINKRVDELLKELITDDMTEYDKIKTVHDYIINNTKYYNDEDKDKLKVGKANGPLFNGYAMCGGYSDLTSIILTKLNINNYRVSTENHIWNLVNLEDIWLHLDLTWDDPVVDTGEDLLLYNFFLIDSNTLSLESNGTTHKYANEIYIEAN